MFFVVTVCVYGTLDNIWCLFSSIKGWSRPARIHDYLRGVLLSVTFDFPQFGFDLWWLPIPSVYSPAPYNHHWWSLSNLGCLIKLTLGIHMRLHAWFISCIFTWGMTSSTVWGFLHGTNVLKAAVWSISLVKHARRHSFLLLTNTVHSFWREQTIMLLPKIATVKPERFRQSLLHLSNMIFFVNLSIVSYIGHYFLSVVFIFVPSDNIEIWWFFLKSLKHVFILHHDCVMLSDSLFVIEWFLTGVIRFFNLAFTEEFAFGGYFDVAS